MKDSRRAEKPAVLVRRAVQQKLRSYRSSEQEAFIRRELAELRKGIGKKPGELPTLWSSIFEALPEELLGQGREPSRGEWAVYTALTLYALHQQGRDIRQECMDREEPQLGEAAARLGRRKASEEAVQRRFYALVTAENMEELSWHLKGFVQLLRQENIPLNYAALAEDLYGYQDSERRASIRLRWGRDYYGGLRRGETEKIQESETTQELS